MLLSAVLIVRDEAKSIAAVIEAALPYVDKFTVLDTGSTDDTIEIARKYDKVAVFEHPFVDYSTTRNLAFDLDAESNPCVFQLVLSADEYLRGGENLRAKLEENRDGDIDCFDVRVLIDGATGFQPRVIRTGSAWRYEGKVHECLVNPNPDAKIGQVLDAAIEHFVSDPERRLARIWERDIPTLKAALEENPADERALVFLAQSYTNLTPYMPAWEAKTYNFKAMAFLQRRLDLDAKDNPADRAQRNYCRQLYLDIARLVGIYTDEEVLARAEELAKDDPERPDSQILYAYALMRCRPAPQVYEVASNAAYVAMRAAEEIGNRSMVSTSVCWRAHLLSAISAKKIAEKYAVDDSGKPWLQIAREHVEAGLKAGGPEQMFASVKVDDAVMPQAIQVEA